MIDTSTIPQQSVAAAADIDRNNGDKIATTIAAFSLEMQSLGLNFALVMLDPTKQTENTAVLGYGGNVAQPIGELMFATYLAMRKDRNVVVNYLKSIQTSTSVQ